MENLESVKRKIRALAAKTVESGCSEAEAMAAMDKVAELLSVFNLSMSEVELHAEKCITGEFQTSKTKSALSWAWIGISKLCGVRCWRVPIQKGWNWKFFGLESDVEMALYLCDLVTKSNKTALAIFRTTSDWEQYQSHRRTLTANFQAGFGSRINVRLKELAEANKEAEKKAQAYHAENSVKIGASDEALVQAAKQSTGTALISVAKERLIEEAFKKQVGIKLQTKKSYAKRVYNSQATVAGQNAANKVNLSRPVGNSSEKAAGYLK